jgi:hypothetical protein
MKTDSLTLSKKVNTDEFGIITKKEFMDLAKRNGWQVDSKTVDGYTDGTFNRSHYNRLAGEAQTQYEAKMREKKTRYYILVPDTSGFYNISEAEFNYFNSL